MENKTNMTKSELIALLAGKNPELNQNDLERVVNTVFDEITQALVEGQTC